MKGLERNNMVKIDSSQSFNKTMYSQRDISKNKTDLTDQMIEEMTASIVQVYQNEAITVTNITEVMREIFKKIDALSVLLEPKDRRDVASEMIDRVIDLKKPSASNFFINKVLKLQANIAIDRIAEETLTEKLSQLSSQQEKHPSLPPLSSHSFSLKSAPSNKVYPVVEEKEEGLVIPSKETSKALERAAIENQHTIHQLIDEAAKYLKDAAKGINKKLESRLEDAQKKVNHAIDELNKTNDMVHEMLNQSLHFEDVVEIVSQEVHEAVDRISEKLQQKTPV